MKKIALLFVVASALFLSSCGTTKAYVGDRQDKSALATIKQGNHKLTPNGWNSNESALLVQVDSISVGNYYKGFPKKCYVLPGKHTVEIRHFQQWNDNQANAAAIGGVLGGAIGGAIAGSIAEKNNPHKHYLVTFNTEAGKTYIIMGVTDPKTREAEIYVTDADDGERIESVYQLEEKK